MELAKLFADALGHEAVIEILLSKEKSESSKVFFYFKKLLSKKIKLMH